MSRKRFIVVSTGQNVANLPPLLEFANPGDEVIWIESAKSREESWTSGPDQVLKEFGLISKRTEHVCEINNPISLIDALDRDSASRDPVDRTLVILNGGTKLTLIGLIYGLNRVNPEYIYGNDERAEYWWFQDFIQKSPIIKPYRHHQLDLQHILATNRFAIMKPNTGRIGLVKIWPDQGKLPECAYGTDYQETFREHSEDFQRRMMRRSTEKVDYSVLRRYLDKSKMDQLEADLKTHFANSDRISPSKFESLCNRILNLAEAAKIQRDHALQSVPKPDVGLGDLFEKAVARRVQAWMIAHQPSCVQSVWLNTKICSQDESDKTVAEYDILFVLKNAILIHLECKAGDKNSEKSKETKRDIESSNYRLSRAASKLARQIVVLPYYAQNTNAEWVEEQKKFRDNCKRNNFTTLLFTLLVSDTTTGPTDLRTDHPEKIESFEDQLEKVIAGFTSV